MDTTNLPRRGSIQQPRVAPAQPGKKESRVVSTLKGLHSLVLFSCFLLLTGSSLLPVAYSSDKDKPPSPETDPLGMNGACYVCHISFVKEPLAKIHLQHKIGCVKCHGLSDKHANDENIGATKPDIIFKRKEVDAGCLKCHKTHNAPATKVVARFLERKLSANSQMVCTDCHGMHKIEKALPGK